MGVTTLEEVTALSEPLQILGNLEVAERLGVSDSRVRQWAEGGATWSRLTSERMNISVDDLLRRLLERDPSLVDENGRLIGVAAEINAGIPYAVRFPLIGQKIGRRAWAFDLRFVQMFEVHPRPRGNPMFGQRRASAEEGNPD